MPRSSLTSTTGFTRLLALMVVLFAASCGVLSSSYAQTISTTPTPVGLSTPVQAADGNFYAATLPTGSCNGISYFGGTGDCGAIYRILPDGTVSLLHAFSPDAGEGFDPNPLTIGPDGSIYGITQGGGVSGCSTRGCGTFFKITPNGATGTFKVIHFFTDTETGATGTAQPVLGDDGYFYEPAFRAINGDMIYKISPSGSFQRLGSFPADVGYPAGKLVQGTDHNFYGGAYSNVAEGGSVYRMTPDGTITSVATLAADKSQGFGPVGLAQGPDGGFYGFTQGLVYGDPYYLATVFKVSPTGTFQTILTTSATTKFVLRSPPFFGSDGNLYGSATYGGDLSACRVTFGAQHFGCGAFIKISTAGELTTLKTFAEDTDGQFPMDTPTQKSDGTLLAPTSHFDKNNPTSPASSGFLYMLNLNLPQPVQLSFTDASGSPVTGSIQPGQPLTLNWKVPAAYSLSASQCYASVQGNLSAAGYWTGRQSGTTDATGFHGSAQVTPSANGTFTYALTCGGTVSGFVTLNLSSKLQITTSSLPNGSVGKPYSNLILLDGGTSPFKFVADGLPPGITMDPTTGYLTGKPTQFGTYQTTIAVQDSSTPALTAGRMFPFTVDSSLMLSGSLKNATVGSQYTGGLTAVGGFGNYKWAISAGTLPEGLTLNATTGVISGKPTKGETATFSITVTDAENPVATVTLATSLSTVAPPLMVVGGDFVDCTVGVLCVNQFEATGGTPPYTWTVAPGATLPAGMTLASDGSFSFKPIQYYDLPFQIEVQVTDSSKPALTATGINSLLITSSLKASPYTLPVATVGQAYTAPAPVATGGLPPYTWTLLFSDYGVKGEYGANADGSLYSPAPKTAGMYTVTYVLKDSEKNQATVQFPVTLTVVAPLTPTTTTLSSSDSTAGSGMNVTLTAKVARSAGVPTGQVTFYSGTTVLGVVSLDGTGSASLATSFNAAGNYNLTAQYSGDATSGGSVSAPLVETVVTPTVTASVAPGTLTVASGSAGTLTVTLSGTGGYSGTATFTCGMLPAHVSCSFAPASVSLSSAVTSGTSTLTIGTGSTANAYNHAPSKPSSRTPVIEVAGLFGLTALCFSRRKASALPRATSALLLLVLGLLSAGSVVGCGSDSSNVKPGTYTVPVTVSVGGTIAQTINVTLVVPSR